MVPGGRLEPAFRDVMAGAFAFDHDVRLRGRGRPL
jgi:hypothetical protein